MKLNLQANNQTFTLFDAAMIIMAVFGVALGLLGLALGHAWVILSLGMALGLGWLVYGSFFAIRQVRVKYERKALVKDPKAWLKAVFIADLHAGGSKKKEWYKNLFDKIKTLSPDMLLVGGDFVVCDSAPVDDLENLKEIDFQYGKYFVLGNHDYLDDPKAIKEQLESWGLKDLTNKESEIVYQGLKLNLSGLDESMFGSPSAGPKGNSPKVILAHEPDLALDLKEGQADLVLSGHTHGGQIRLPLVGSIFVPSKLGRRVDQGWRVINGVQMFVTKGIGEVLCRARLFCPPEIVVIELGI